METGAMKNDVEEFVTNVVELAELDLDVRVEQTGDAADDLRVVLAGPDRGMLLSRGAELLDALEYLTNRCFGKQIGHDGKIAFDSGNYRALREQELQLMAKMAAERVRSSKAAFAFEPMSPSERRIIHLALADDPSVRTESVGDGFERKVKVIPAK
jgi:spoIIIJ-associated protein